MLCFPQDVTLFKNVLTVECQPLSIKDSLWKAKREGTSLLKKDWQAVAKEALSGNDLFAAGCPPVFIKARVSIIKVASRFEQSNWLYQEGAVSPLLLEWSGGMFPQKMFEFQSPKMWFPVFWGLNWEQKNVFFIQENIFSFRFHTINQFLQAMNKCQYSKLSTFANQ